MSLTRKLSVTITLVIGLCYTPTASALVPDGQTYAELRIAQGFWEERTPELMTNCSQYDITFERMEDSTTLGYSYGKCDMTLSNYWSRKARAGGKSWRSYLILECFTVVHEMGHAIGWMPPKGKADPDDPYHSKSGLMAAFYEHDTYACIQWARDTVNRYRLH